MTAAALAIVVLVTAVGFALAAVTYLGLERLGRRSWPALVARGVAWSALGLLLVNISCPIDGAAARPLVLLDRSLSMDAAGGRWAEARALADSIGEVRFFGDDRASSDSLPRAGRTLLVPALTAAAAAARPVVVVTDGEIEDAAELPPDVAERTGVRLLPRERVDDVAIVRVTAPDRITAGDSLPVDADVRSFGDTTERTVTVQVRSGARVLAARPAVVGRGVARVRIPVAPGALPAGEHLITITLADSGDAEPRTDTRQRLVSVAPTPGIVMIAAPGGWDARFLYRALEDVAELPVRGYVQLVPGSWRTMHDLQPVSAAEVARSARGADLLVLKGEGGQFATGTTAQGVWLWPSGETGEAVLRGDWYLDAAPVSPIAGAFLGAPVDSFPPATQVVPILPGEGDWVGLTARESRRGAERPVVVGSERGRRRTVTVAADGLWRWAFLGGASEQAYRAWAGATVSWLLGGADSAGGRARPVQPVVQQGQPLVFTWRGGGAPEAVEATFSGSDTAMTDTLAFDADGRAEVVLPPGEYRYRLADGGDGRVVVEQYSDELIPRPVRLEPREARTVTGERRSPAREWIWLFGIAVAGLAGEWLARRRLGLR